MRTCECDTVLAWEIVLALEGDLHCLSRGLDHLGISSDGGVCDMQAKSEHLVAQRPAVKSCCVQCETKLCVTRSDLGICSSSGVSNPARERGLVRFLGEILIVGHVWPIGWFSDTAG